MLVFMIHDVPSEPLLRAATPGRVHAQGLCCWVGGMLIIVIHTATGDHADVCDQVSLPQTTVVSVARAATKAMWMSVDIAASGNHV